MRHRLALILTVVGAVALPVVMAGTVLYASDAARTPELYYLAARWWREALAEVLPELLGPDEVEEVAELILRGNALELYRR